MLTRQRKAELRQEALLMTAKLALTFTEGAYFDRLINSEEPNEWNQLDQDEIDEFDRQMKAIAAGLRRRVKR